VKKEENLFYEKKLTDLFEILEKEKEKEKEIKD
jgi:hypothetical protein